MTRIGRVTLGVCVAAWSTSCAAEHGLHGADSSAADASQPAVTLATGARDDPASAPLDALPMGLERALSDRDTRFHPVRDERGVRVAQPGGPTAHITASGATIAFGARELRVSVTSVARPRSRVPLSAAPPAISGGEARRDLGHGVVEWWRALPSGLEHGATLSERPPGEGALIVDVALDGLDVGARSETSVELSDPSGVRVAGYERLVVVDADGTRVPARMRARRGGVSIEVDDSDVSYPLIIDPLVVSEEATLLASDGALYAALGYAVAVSADGSRAVAGAPYEYRGGRAYAGSARVFVRSGSSWTEEATLLAPDGPVREYFGRSVAMSADGTRALVGAPTDVFVGSATGSARVFVRSGSSWIEEALLVAADGAANDGFGWSVALSADASRALVGAPADDDAGVTDVGSVRVFVRTASSWAEEATLRALDREAFTDFGRVVALSGDGSRALVGAPLDDAPGGLDAGSAHVFVRRASGWTEEATLLAPDGALNDNLGTSVALSEDGSRALLGAAWDDTPGGRDVGSARMFVRSGGAWAAGPTLLASDGAANDHFGWSVALDSAGTRAIVGAPDDDASGRTREGSVRVFLSSGGRWIEGATVLAHDDVGGDFGASVALTADGSGAAVGAPFDETGGPQAGSVRVFTLMATEGTPCAIDLDCASGFCTDGVCCASACGAGAADCQACSIAAGGTADGTCTTLSSAVARTITCRPAGGACDVAEVCSGTSMECPADLLAPPTTVCRPSIGECDVAETCLGTSASCPADAARPAGSACGGPLVGECDAQDECSGSVGASAVCEPRFALAATSCRSASCTAGSATMGAMCDGASASCPAATTIECGPYACDGDSCLTACTTDEDCASEHACSASTCLPRDTAPGGRPAGGCGCSVPRRLPSNAPAALLFALALAGAARRSRRSR